MRTSGRQLNIILRIGVLRLQEAAGAEGGGVVGLVLGALHGGEWGNEFRNGISKSESGGGGWVLVRMRKAVGFFF